MRFAYRFFLALILGATFATGSLAQERHPLAPGNLTPPVNDFPHVVRPVYSTTPGQVAPVADQELPAQEEQSFDAFLLPNHSGVAPAVLLNWHPLPNALAAGWLNRENLNAECQCENCTCEDCQCSGGTCECEGCSEGCSCENCSCEECECSGGECECENCSAECQCENCSCEDCQCSGGECQCEGCSEDCSCENCSCEECECSGGECQCENCSAECQCENCSCEDCQCSGGTCECEGCSGEGCEFDTDHCQCEGRVSECECRECPCSGGECSGDSCRSGGCSSCPCERGAQRCQGGECSGGQCQRSACTRCAGAPFDSGCECRPPQGACWEPETCCPPCTCCPAEGTCGTLRWLPRTPAATAEVCDQGAPIVTPPAPVTAEVCDITQAREHMRRLGVDPLAGSCFDQTGCGVTQFSQRVAQYAERANQAWNAGQPCPPCPTLGVWMPTPPAVCMGAPLSQWTPEPMPESREVAERRRAMAQLFAAQAQGEAYPPIGPRMAMLPPGPQDSAVPQTAGAHPDSRQWYLDGTPYPRTTNPYAAPQGPTAYGFTQPYPSTQPYPTTGPSQQAQVAPTQPLAPVAPAYYPGEPACENPAERAALLRQVSRQLDQTAEMLEEQGMYDRADQLRRMSDEYRQAARMFRLEQTR